MLRWAFDRLLFAPFLALYVHGPALAGVGFWSGRDQADICATITTLPRHVFTADPMLCETIIHREARALLVTVSVCLYFWSVLWTLLCVQSLVHALVRRAVLGRGVPQMIAM